MQQSVLDKETFSALVVRHQTALFRAARAILPTDEDENKVQKAVMFKYIVAMAQEMGLECISEGVETKEQVQLLAENNCNLAQGFYFDRPLPVAEFEKRLEKGYVYNK